MRFPGALFAGLLLTVSACGNNSPTGREDQGGPFSDNVIGAHQDGYVLTLLSDSFGTTQLTGEDVTTLWNEGTGFIYLGADDVKEPLGTITLTLGPPQHEGGAWIMFIETATVSKTDVRVGTADELNGVLYEADLSGSHYINLDQIGANFIEGHIQLALNRVIVYEGDEPDTAVLQGTIVARAN